MKTTLMSLVSLITFGLVADAEPLAVGAPAPQISAVDQDGKAVNFKDVYAKGPTLVYFYPKADTPGCTKQACSIRDDWSALQARGIQVLGVSGDKPDAQKKFQDKFKLPFTLIADSDSKVAEAFGVPTTMGNCRPAGVSRQVSTTSRQLAGASSRTCASGRSSRFAGRPGSAPANVDLTRRTARPAPRQDRVRA